jgi:hypothetical protein
MIRNGRLGALNLGTPLKPRFIVLPHHLQEFERRHQAATEPAPAPRRRRRATEAVDFYPD